MSQKIYVGNLSFRSSNQDLEELFGQYGNVTEARVVNDRETGRSRGFGFVSFDSAEAAESAVNAQNGQDFQGRDLKVSIAKEQNRQGGGRRY